MQKEKVNVLVTGGQGQLGSELRDLSNAHAESNFTFVDLNDLDLTKSEDVATFFDSREFHAVVNCAAYTAVDLAEDQPDLAYKVNAESVKVLAEICLRKKIRLIHISTDYVFDGKGNVPIDENSEPAPLSVYGKSKLEGERFVLSALPDAYVIRTAWVYSSYGKNFVKTISNLARQRPELSVVADQIGTPTYAHDLAATILQMLQAIFEGRVDQPGIYHYTNEGAISWYDLAHFIVRYYKLPCNIKAITTAEYKTKAVRPRFSVLDKRKIRDTFGIQPPHWHDSLITCLKKMEPQA